jgi:hypothetical protein
MTMSWSTRYAAGEGQPVWDEIVGVGAALRDDPLRWDDAVAVAHDLVGRIRRNAETVRDHLADQGYEFQASEPIRPPASDITSDLDLVEAEIGAFPMVLRVFLEEIGTINLNGSHPQWTFDYPDPFSVEYFPGYAVSEYRQWKEDGWFEKMGRDGFPIALAPDYFHKADVSGSSPYEIELPDASTDPLWLNDDLHEGKTFVGYARSALLGWAGFPGFARKDPDNTGRPHQPLPADLAELRGRLEAF